MAMSDHSSPPVIFITCLSLLLLIAFPQVSHSQSAIGQLEQMTGQKIIRYNVNSPMLQTPGGIMGMMLLQSIISEALSENAADNSQGAVQQRAELEAWLKGEQQRLNNLVKQQRAKRDVEDIASMEEMTKALGSGFDTPIPNSDLASALSDPNVVDLRGYPVDKPLFIKNLEQAPDLPFQSPVARKLRKMINENQDARKLYQRQRCLEDQLTAIQQRAKDIQNSSEATAKDFDDYEKWLVSVTGETLMEGLSLILTQSTQLISKKEMTKAMGRTMLDRLTELRNNPIEYDKTLEAMGVIINATFLTSDSINYAVSEKKLMDAVDLIGGNIPGVKSIHFKYGRSLYISGRTLAKEKEIWDEIQKLESAKTSRGELKLGQTYWQNQKKIDQEIRGLIKTIKENREQLAKKIGVSPDSLKELPRTGLDSKVPPL
jgi:hypothetical protein